MKHKELNEKMKLIDLSLDSLLVRSPLKALREAIDNKRWFEGIAMSAVFLEYLGIDKLMEYLRQKQIPIKRERFQKFSLEMITDLLFDFEIIDNSIHSKMVEVRKERNKIIHPHEDHPHPDKIDPNKARATIEKAIECLVALGIT
jgi:hypothetical protein